MEGPFSNINLSNAHGKNLEFLLEIFGSVISLDDMASAYCQAGYDLTIASEILYNMLGSSSRNDIGISKDDLTKAPASSVGVTAGASSVGVTAGTVSGANSASYARSKTINEPAMVLSRPKPRTSGVSVGSVSGIIGADYGRFRAKTKETYETTKPVKLRSDEIPASQIWVEKPQSTNTARTEKMNKDIEMFLLEMLGDGFQLDINVMREVLGGCGYDVQESMEKLMNMSAPTLNLGHATSSMVDQKPTNTHQDLGVELKDKLQISCSDSSKRSNLEREIVTNLFKPAERSEVEPGTILPQPRTRKYGVVHGPLQDIVVQFTNPIVKQEVNGDGKELEDNYDTLREAVMEHFATMKQYYRAAADAYAKGNYELSYKLVEQGHLYMAKAREADEACTKMLIQTRDDGEVITLNVTDYDAREAVRLLKTQLNAMCGIPSIHYLKVVVGPDDDVKKKPNARKRLITKLLERETITFTEEQNGEIMAIRIDVINPKRLSFNKK